MLLSPFLEYFLGHILGLAQHVLPPLLPSAAVESMKATISKRRDQIIKYKTSIALNTFATSMLVTIISIY